MATDKKSAAFLIDAKAVRTLAEILNEIELTEIEYELESGRIRVARNVQAAAQVTYAQPASVSIATAPASAAAPAPSPMTTVASSDDWASHPGAIKSPLVGTAYLSPQPGAAPFIKEGDTIQEGQTLMILEAMKVMNPIRAVKSGKVLKILIDNGQPVEFGEVLVVLA